MSTTESVTEFMPSVESNDKFYTRRGDNVWRVFYQDTLEKDNRYRAFAYHFNEADGLLEYGGAVYRHEPESGTFNKRRVRNELSHTARHRFQVAPVRLVLKEVKDVKDRNELHQRITKAAFKYHMRAAERVKGDPDKVEIHGTA